MSRVTTKGDENEERKLFRSNEIGDKEQLSPLKRTKKLRRKTGCDLPPRRMQATEYASRCGTERVIP